MVTTMFNLIITQSSLYKQAEGMFLSASKTHLIIILTKNHANAGISVRLIYRQTALIDAV